VPFRRVAAEIEAGGGGDADLLQQVAGQREAVVGQARTIAIQVESAFRAGGDAEADIFEGRREEVAAPPEFGAPRFENGNGLRQKGGQGGVLRRGRRTENEVLRQFLDVADIRLGNHHPAQSPAGHLEIFRETVDDPDVVTSRAGGRSIGLVGQAVVDLVDQKMGVVLATGCSQRLDLG